MSRRACATCGDSRATRVPENKREPQGAPWTAPRVVRSELNFPAPVYRRYLVCGHTLLFIDASRRFRCDPANISQGARGSPRGLAQQDCGRNDFQTCKVEWSGRKRMRLRLDLWPRLRKVRSESVFERRSCAAWGCGVGTGSREENASKQETKAPFPCNRNGKG